MNLFERIDDFFFSDNKGRGPYQKNFCGKENFELCASAPTKNTIISFPCAGNFFSVLD